MVIQISGTGGSGKSTVVQCVMELFSNRRPEFVPGRKRPMRYQMGHLPEPLVVLGHYETPCGGCDTIKTVDQVYSEIVSALEVNCNVLCEGIMLQDDVRRAVELSKHHSLYVIRLSTPVEECLARIRGRRAAAGNEKPLSEKNTRGRYESQLRRCQRLKDAGVAVEVLDCEAAFLRVRELLGV